MFCVHHLILSNLCWTAATTGWWEMLTYSVMIAHQGESWSQWTDSVLSYTTRSNMKSANSSQLEIKQGCSIKTSEWLSKSVFYSSWIPLFICRRNVLYVIAKVALSSFVLVSCSFKVNIHICLLLNALYWNITCLFLYIPQTLQDSRQFKQLVCTGNFNKKKKTLHRSNQSKNLDKF